MNITLITAEQLKERLGDHEEIALIDVREHGEYGERHPFQSVNVPFSHFELEITERVPNIFASIVLFDEADEGRARRCAQIAIACGYNQINILKGGACGWEEAGFTLFAGVNVPSKTFGELVHEHYNTPSISALQLSEWQASARPITVLDGRTEAEYQTMSIPNAKSCPNGEMSLRGEAMVQDRTQPVVINCAGRTRSIIGAQILRTMAPELEVFALENGTQGWRLAGLDLEHDKDQFYPADIKPSKIQQSRARRWALDCGAAEIGEQELQSWFEDAQRTSYLLDIRTKQEYLSGHLDGFVHAPGGQLIQATDHWIGAKYSKVLVFSGDDCRAPNIAGWLALLGYETAWYSGTAEQWQKFVNIHPLKNRPSQLELRDISQLPVEASVLDQYYVLDVRHSSMYRKGHYTGSDWLNRANLAEHLATVTDNRSIALVSDDSANASLLVEDIEKCGRKVAGWLPLDPDQPQRSGVHIEQSPNSLADDKCIDFLFFVHDRHLGNLEAAKRYLEWETGLLAKLDNEERHSFSL